MTSTQGLTDEQVEELLHALLDFHSLLVGLTDRFHSRLAQLEQQFSQERSAAPVLGQPIPSGPLPRPETRAAEPETQSTPGSISLLKELEDEVFEPDTGEEFAIVDFDDDEF